jgi:hypothetical protein
LCAAVVSRRQCPGHGKVHRQRLDQHVKSNSMAFHMLIDV